MSALEGLTASGFLVSTSPSMSLATNIWLGVQEPSGFLQWNHPEDLDQRLGLSPPGLETVLPLTTKVSRGLCE